MRQAHWVAANETSRIPGRHIILDTEAHSTRTAAGQTQTWRCAAAVFMHRTRSGRWLTTTAEYEDPAALWADVTAFTRPRRRTVLWAHNVGYDIRISQAMLALPGHGWTYQLSNMADRGAWQRWTRGEHTLTLVDSGAVFPVGLDAVGRAVGIDKPPLPDQDDDPDAWRARCAADTAILAEAVRTYLDWLTEADLGCWQLTGAGQSWAAWRHRFLTDKVLVHDDGQAIAAERRAMWTGRCETWRHGADPDRRLWEWDAQAAYATLARDTAVPTRLIGAIPKPALPRLLTLEQSHRWLVECQVDTAVPVVPTEVDGRILWPVGTFTSTMWDCEVREALRCGARITPTRGWLYKAAPALSAWAQWILTLLDGGGEPVHPLVRIVAKHWSRALIGRLAMRYQQWDPWAVAPDHDWSRGILLDAVTGDTTDLVRVGTEIHIAGGEVESDNSLPQITGYIMAAARVQLWRAMQTAGLSHVYYVDTDSVLLDATGHRRLSRALKEGNPYRWRVKARHDGYQLLGPRQLVLGDEPRFAGMPRRPVQTGGGAYEGEAWQTLNSALRQGNATQVLISRRPFTPRGVDTRRVHTPHGQTGAVLVLDGQRVDDDPDAGRPGALAAGRR